MAKKSNNNANKRAQQEAAKKAEEARIEAEKEEAAKKAEEKNKWKPKKVKLTLGFSKRNYSVGGKLVLIERGKEISEADYMLFDANARELFFEDI
jgi:hypothetical protein